MDLFDALYPESSELELAPGAVLLRGFASKKEDALLDSLQRVVALAPFRHMTTPGGFRMSVGMTNCGALGWVTDRKGYRYDPIDPLRGRVWPLMPEPFSELAKNAAAKAGFEHFAPDACLINRYEPGAKLSLHQDKDERDFSQPIVSVSLGLSATFLFGGMDRSGPAARIRVDHGDVAVWGGASRLRYHGILALKDGVHPVLGRQRINLTFRKSG